MVAPISFLTEEIGTAPLFRARSQVSKVVPPPGTSPPQTSRLGGVECNLSRRQLLVLISVFGGQRPPSPTAHHRKSLARRPGAFSLFVGGVVSSICLRHLLDPGL